LEELYERASDELVERELDEFEFLDRREPVEGLETRGRKRGKKS
jgi:hypothetical protein